MKDTAAAMAKDYVMIEIDVDRMAMGKHVADKLTGGQSKGFPWTVILDGEGNQLVTSDGPKGNIGCPVTDEESSWFLEMIDRTRQHMSDADRAAIARDLATHATKINAARRR
ncbi:MAG: hypothetical protein KDB53_04785 [Planctomycetes bacterium]|nr:hypothetical protein [Planctomycetota bacterium]